MEQKNTEKNNRMRRYIRIRDEDMWGKIDRIMQEPQYSKSFNKVINDALYYGLDELMRHLFEREETLAEEQKQIRDQKLIRRVDGLNETYFIYIRNDLCKAVGNGKL